MKIMAILIAVVALVSGANASDNASNSAAATMAIADPSRPNSDQAASRTRTHTYESCRRQGQRHG
jgi:hypothetical protein